MFEELNEFVGWNSANLPYNQLILIASEKSDGAFLLHHFISLFLKSEGTVILISAAQGFPHYNVVCSKLGVNLERFRSSGKLKILDLLRASMASYTDDRSQIAVDDQVLMNVFQYNSLEFLFQAVKKNLKPNSRNVVILDDLSILLNIGFTENQIVTFLHYMKVLSVHNDCGFVTHLQKDVLSETHGPFLYTHCQHYSTYEFRLRGLDSGYCKDVHGDLDFIARTNNIVKTSTVQRMQYKLTDRSLKLFAPGTSVAVL